MLLLLFCCCCSAAAVAAAAAVQELLDRHKRVRQERIALLRSAAWRRISRESAGSQIC
jgi:phage protein D